MNQLSKNSCNSEACNVFPSFGLINSHRKRDKPEFWRTWSQIGEFMQEVPITQYAGCCGGCSESVCGELRCPTCFPCCLGMLIADNSQQSPCLAWPSAKERCFAQVYASSSEATAFNDSSTGRKVDIPDLALSWDISERLTHSQSSYTID